MAETTRSGTTRRSVLVSFVVDCAETLGLGVTAGVTGSVALRAQTAANAADVAVQVFLLIGVLSSVRPPDQTHPLGYGRERFFWSLLAALGIFLGGGVLGLDEAVHAELHPSAVHSYPVAYLVLVTTVVDGDVSFADDLDVPAVEQTILHCVHVLREGWPKIKYVYLTPVGKARPTRAARSGVLAADGKQPRPPSPPGSKSSTGG